MGLMDGGTEWIIIILVIVVLLVGAKKIPEFARSLGRATGEFRRGKMEVEKEIRQAHYEKDDEPVEAKPAEANVIVRKESKIVSAARDLGIPTEGKTEEELKKEIVKKASS